MIETMLPYVIALIAVIIGVIGKIRRAKTGQEVIDVISESAPDVYERVNEILVKGKIIKDGKNTKQQSNDSEKPIH